MFFFEKIPWHTKTNKRKARGGGGLGWGHEWRGKEISLSCRCRESKTQTTDKFNLGFRFWRRVHVCGCVVRRALIPFACDGSRGVGCRVLCQALVPPCSACCFVFVHPPNRLTHTALRVCPYRMAIGARPSLPLAERMRPGASSGVVFRFACAGPVEDQAGPSTGS